MIYTLLPFYSIVSMHGEKESGILRDKKIVEKLHYIPKITPSVDYNK